MGLFTIYLLVYWCVLKLYSFHDSVCWILSANAARHFFGQVGPQGQAVQLPIVASAEWQCVVVPSCILPQRPVIPDGTFTPMMTC